MKLITKDDRFVARTSYDERTLPKQAGFRWDPAEKCWWTTDSSKAQALRDFADEETAETLARLAEIAQVSLEASRATDADIDIPAPEGKKYMPFQRAGIAYALSHPAALIADEMGLGKTIQAIGVINADESLKSILIVCPLLVKLNWRDEISKWLTRDLRVGMADTKTWSNAEIVIIHPDALTARAEDLRSKEWDLIVVDEAHYFKNPKSQRSQALFGHGKMKPPVQARRKLCLTGTPIPNRPIEMFSLLSWLDSGSWNNWAAYARRYCAGKSTGWGWDVSGASNLEELQQKLRASLMVRRLKVDVLTELPPKRRQVIVLDAETIPGGTQIIQRERQALEAYEDSRVAAEIAMELAETPEAYEEAVANLQERSSSQINILTQLRHETALAKAPTVIEHVKSLLDDGTPKLTLWAHHKDVVSLLEDGLKEYGVVKITGDVKSADREKAVFDFQNDPKVRVFLGSITAAGVGITLTEATVAVFAELDWVPGNITQAEDRIHRIGQVESVLIQHIVLDESIDAKLAKTIVKKQEIAEQALDRETEGSNVYTLPDAIKLPEPTPTAKKKNKGAKSHTDTNPVEYPVLPDEEIAELQGKIRLLAALDGDRAQEINAMGFSKFDSGMGHALAEAEHWTPKMCAIAQKLTHKYRRQVG
jgi:SWI/SNF-related matrix-associated actin-dependent regulator 1 of chromatin subfamily A